MSPKGLTQASRARPAVYLLPNHWWHSLDVWAPLTLIPAYHKHHCCQARDEEVDSWHTTMMNNRATMESHRRTWSEVYWQRAQYSSVGLTSLNSWIWACSNMEKTLELAPSALLFLAFFGAFGHKQQTIKRMTHHTGWLTSKICDIASKDLCCTVRAHSLNFQTQQ